MFCFNCGTQLSEGTNNCPTCSTPVEGKAKLKAAMPLALMGIFWIVYEFLLMPIKTLKSAYNQLYKIGKDKGIDSQSTDTPHLTFLHIMGNVIVSFLIIGSFVTVLFIAVIASFLGAYATGSFNASILLFYLFAAFLGGYLNAVIINWLFMLLLELLFIGLIAANNLKAIANNTQKHVNNARQSNDNI